MVCGIRSSMGICGSAVVVQSVRFILQRLADFLSTRFSEESRLLVGTDRQHRHSVLWFEMVRASQRSRPGMSIIS